MQAENNTSKDRKSEEQKRHEAAENAGLFIGTDEDAKMARDQATATATADETRPRVNMDNDGLDAGEAQNVTDGTGRMEGKEAEQARNKATEGMRQGRDDSQRSGNNDRNRNDNDEYGRD